MEKKEKAIHLKLTDNKTGKVILDTDGHFLLGALCTDDKACMGIVDGRCNRMIALHVLQTLDTLKERLYKEDPELEMGYKLFKMLGLDKRGKEVTELDLSAILKHREQQGTDQAEG